MSNPALELAAIFENWEVPGGSSVENARGYDPADPLAFWHNHLHATELLASIEAELRAMEASGDDVTVYTNYLSHWYAGLFSYENGWRPGLSNGARAISEPALGMLRGLGLLLGKVGMSSVRSPTQRTTLLSCIEGAIALLETELDEWDRSEKEYLFRLLEAARRALRETTVLGDIDLRSLINELIGALTGIALDIRASEGKDSSRFQKFMDWIGTTAGVLRGIIYDAEALSSLTASVATISKMLTPGS